MVQVMSITCRCTFSSTV